MNKYIARYKSIHIEYSEYGEVEIFNKKFEIEINAENKKDAESIAEKKIRECLEVRKEQKYDNEVIIELDEVIDSNK